MLIGKMRSFLSHVGAWSPKPEQVATAKFLNNQSAVDNYLTSFKKSIQDRLNGFYTHFQFLKASGYPIDCIAPQAAIYLTVKIDLIGAKKSDGSVIDSVQSTTSFLLNEASIAMVPFYAFGASKDSKWYRLSVGTCTIEDMHHSMEKLSSALKTLSF
jgi:aspartate aminotransferase